MKKDDDYNFFCASIAKSLGITGEEGDSDIFKTPKQELLDN